MGNRNPLAPSKKRYYIKLTSEQMKDISLYAQILSENAKDKKQLAEINNSIIQSKHEFCMACTFGSVCIYQEGKTLYSDWSEYEELTLIRDESMGKADDEHIHYFLSGKRSGRVAYYKAINMKKIKEKQQMQNPKYYIRVPTYSSFFCCDLLNRSCKKQGITQFYKEELDRENIIIFKCSFGVTTVVANPNISFPDAEELVIVSHKINGPDKENKQLAYTIEVKDSKKQLAWFNWEGRRVGNPNLKKSDNSTSTEIPKTMVDSEGKSHEIPKYEAENLATIKPMGVVAEESNNASTLIKDNIVGFDPASDFKSDNMTRHAMACGSSVAAGMHMGEHIGYFDKNGDTSRATRSLNETSLKTLDKIAHIIEGQKQLQQHIDKQKLDYDISEELKNDSTNSTIIPSAANTKSGPQPPYDVNKIAELVTKINEAQKRQEHFENIEKQHNELGRGAECYLENAIGINIVRKYDAIEELHDYLGIKIKRS